MRALEQMRERVERAEAGQRDAVQDAAAAAANAADADARAAAARGDAERVVARGAVYAYVAISTCIKISYESNRLALATI